MKTCRHCGLEIPDEAAFCVHCGKSVAQAGPAPGELAFADTTFAGPATRSDAPPPSPVSQTRAWMPAAAEDIDAPAPLGASSLAPRERRGMYVRSDAPSDAPYPSPVRDRAGGAPRAPAAAPPREPEPPVPAATEPPPAYRVPQPARAPAAAPPREPESPAPAATEPPPAHRVPQPARATVADLELDRGLRIAGAVLGVLLLAYFFVPVGERHEMLWDRLALAHLTDVEFMRWLYPAGMGLLLLVLGLLPLPPAVRGSLYAAIGLGPFAFGLLRAEMLLGRSVEAWRGALFAVSMLLCPFGHLLRVRRRESPLPRVLVGLALAALLAVYLVPLPGIAATRGMPIASLFSGPLEAVDYVARGWLAVPALLALLSTAAFAGRRSSGGGNWLATLFLLWVPLAFVTHLVRGAATGASPADLLEASRLMVYAFACQFLVVYGLIHLFPARRRPAEAQRSVAA